MSKNYLVLQNITELSCSIHHHKFIFCAMSKRALLDYPELFCSISSVTGKIQCRAWRTFCFYLSCKSDK